MKNKYFAVISRDEFIKLYRFGNLNINLSCIVNVDERRYQKIEDILKTLSFEYEEGYLVLKFEDKTFEINREFGKISIIYSLDIKDIKNIYTLSEMAQNFYSTKFNPKIKFSVIPSENILKNIQRDKEFKDMNKGVNVLFEQFKISNKQQIEEKFGYDFKEKLLDYLSSNNYLDKNYENFYLDLLSYKRENKFSKKDVGFIYDLLAIALLKDRKKNLILRFKQGELKFNDSPTYKLLEENIKNSLIEYIDYIADNENENVKKFKKSLTFDNIIIGSIFLKIKSLLDNDYGKKDGYQDELKKLISDFRDKYEDNLGIALYLAGVFFGYKNLYDDYYDYLDLDIFNDNSTITEINESDKNHNDLDNLKAENKKLKNDNNETANKMTENFYLEKFLMSLDINSLADIYYREDKNNKKLGDIKKEYRDNKTELVNKIKILKSRSVQYLKFPGAKAEV